MEKTERQKADIDCYKRLARRRMNMRLTRIAIVFLAFLGGLVLRGAL